MFRSRWIVFFIVPFLIVGCRRPSAEKPAAAPVVDKAKPAPVHPLATLQEKIKSDGKPPALTASDLLTVYDDNRLAGDQNFKGLHIWLTGPIKKVDSAYGKPFILMWDGLNRPISIQINFVKDDQPLLGTLHKDEVIAVWGRVQGLASGNVVVQNAALLTKERQESLK